MLHPIFTRRIDRVLADNLHAIVVCTNKVYIIFGDGKYRTSYTQQPRRRTDRLCFTAKNICECDKK